MNVETFIAYMRYKNSCQSMGLTEHVQDYAQWVQMLQVLGYRV